MKINDEHIIKRTIEAHKLPKLSTEQQALLESLAEKPDSEIDYSDAPAAPLDAKWYKTSLSPLYRPTKQITTVRLDADVLVWLKSKGRGYQTRMNAILRESMVQELRQQSRE